MTDLKERRGLDGKVYQPAEDSYLLAKSVSAELQNRDDNPRVLDVGTGSGFIAEYIKKHAEVPVIGTDINPHACQEAQNRGIEVIRGNLVEPFHRDAFDVIVCNPPYLPDSPEGTFDDWMEVALSGQTSGKDVIDQLLEASQRVLKPDGLLYLLISTLTGIDEVIDSVERTGRSAAVIAEDNYPFETLVVLKII